MLAKLTFIDEKSVYKRNLSSIARDCNTTIENLSPASVKSDMNYFSVPSHEEWRIPLLQNLLAVRSAEWHLDNYDRNEVALMINHVCTTWL